MTGSVQAFGSAPTSELALQRSSAPGYSRVPSAWQPAVDDQRGQDGQREHPGAQPQPPRAGVTLDRLVTDLLLKVRIHLFQLVQAGRRVRLAAGQLGDLLQRLVVDRHRLALVVDLDIAVRRAE